MPLKAVAENIKMKVIGLKMEDTNKLIIHSKKKDLSKICVFFSHYIVNFGCSPILS